MDGIVYITLEQAKAIHAKQLNTAVVAHTNISIWDVLIAFL